MICSIYWITMSNFQLVIRYLSLDNRQILLDKQEYVCTCITILSIMCIRLSLVYCFVAFILWKTKVQQSSSTWSIVCLACNSMTWDSNSSQLLPYASNQIISNHSLLPIRSAISASRYQTCTCICTREVKTRMQIHVNSNWLENWRFCPCFIFHDLRLT